jgi:hypothetical protein
MMISSTSATSNSLRPMAGASERACVETFHMDTIDAHHTPGDREAPDKAQCSRGRGDDEHSHRMIDILDLDRDLI